MIPVNVVAPKSIDTNDINLKRNYSNYNIGNLIADDKSFSFFRYFQSRMTARNRA